MSTAVSGNGASGSSVPRVLVVDDNPALIDNLAEILSDAGYSVLSASTCAGARRAASEGFDVALVDVQLPDGDGIALAGEIKKSRPGREVVLLTGFASVESAAAAIRAGACAYLVKPCAIPELLLTVGQAMRQVRMHDETRDLERRTKVAEKLATVGTLTAGLSHEIRNPLNAAALQLTVLERRLRKMPSEQQGPLLEPLGLVRDEIRRLDHILEDFLRFARPREVELRRVDLTQLLARSADLLHGDAESRGVTLLVESATCPPIPADPDQLHQVLINLGLNAMDAAGRGGRVRLRLASRETSVALVVDDSGPGIAPDVRERIFEPFFTTKANGSGLGLAIVSAIIQQHGGTVLIGSNEWGGARFEVQLPNGS